MQKICSAVVAAIQSVAPRKSASHESADGTGKLLDTRTVRRRGYDVHPPGTTLAQQR